MVGKVGLIRTHLDRAERELSLVAQSAETVTAVNFR
jgi:hypothetical protein